MSRGEIAVSGQLSAVRKSSNQWSVRNNKTSHYSQLSARKRAMIELIRFVGFAGFVGFIEFIGFVEFVEFVELVGRRGKNSRESSKGELNG